MVISKAVIKKLQGIGIDHKIVLNTIALTLKLQVLSHVEIAVIVHSLLILKVN